MSEAMNERTKTSTKKNRKLVCVTMKRRRNWKIIEFVNFSLEWVASDVEKNKILFKLCMGESKDWINKNKFNFERTFFSSNLLIEWFKAHLVRYHEKKTFQNEKNSRFDFAEHICTMLSNVDINFISLWPTRCLNICGLSEWERKFNWFYSFLNIRSYMTNIHTI